MRDVGSARGRRSRRRARSSGASSGGNGRPRNRTRGRSGNRSARSRTQGGLPPQQDGDKNSILGWRQTSNGSQQRSESREEGPPDAFGLFCAYHLGITVDDRYQKPSLNDVARRYSITPEEVKELLVKFRLDSETMKNCQFDLKGAQLDVRVAPEGISRVEIARDHYQEFVEQLD